MSSTTNARPGRGWAYFGAILGGSVSIAANVAHSYVPPAAPEGVVNVAAWQAEWSPQPGAVLGSVFWPLALFVGIEIVTRVQWPTGRWWIALRFGGMLPVALVAAVVSYRHLSGLLSYYGEDWLTVAIGPLAVDGLMVTATGALLAASVRAALAAERATDQAWFWTPEWQAGEREASEQIAAGQTKSYDSMDALLDVGAPTESVPVPAEAAPSKPAPAKSARRTNTATAVARLRAKHPRLTQADAAKRLGVTERTVRRYWNPTPTEPVNEPTADAPASAPLAA